MNHKSFTHFGRVFLILILCIVPIILFAQTNPPPGFDASMSPLPTSAAGYWDYAIALVTPILVWLFARFGPSIPTMVLPLLAPVVGLLLGALMNWLAGAHLSWVDMAKAGALAVFIRESVNQLVTKRINGDVITKTGAVAALVLCLAVTGCAHKLAPGGAYAPTAVMTNPDGSTVTNAVSAPDMELYTADAAFDFAHSAVLTAMEFERDNRDLLWRIDPNIKHTLDRFRPQIVAVATQWAQARKAYIAHPTPANLSTIQEAIAKIRAINAAVTAAIPARK